MRKKITACLVLAAVLVTGLGAALAAPGTDSDPFVTRSYLTGVYLTETEQAMLLRAQAGTAAVEQAALDKLNTLAKGYLARAGGGTHAGSFLRLTLSRGDRLELPTGAGLLFEAGQGELAFPSGSLVDVTDGSPLIPGGSLTAGHHYVAAEDTTCIFTVTSDAAILSVQGYYTLERTGAVQTPFTDLTSTDWYYPYVRFSYEQGLFQGLTATQFSPNANTNRAMLATALRRLAGVEGEAPGVGFSDVSPDDWYADAVNWAAIVGIVTGYDDGTFLPYADVTREQMAAMLYRYVKDYMGLNVPADGSLSAFSDRALVSSWAEEPLSWAVGAGIITGYENGALGPGGTATRAEVATMLRRFSDYLAGSAVS